MLDLMNACLAAVAACWLTWLALNAIDTLYRRATGCRVGR